MFTFIYRLLCGYVSFTAQGGFTERFLNLCGRNRIYLWNLRLNKNNITACTSAKHYKKNTNLRLTLRHEKLNQIKTRSAVFGKKASQTRRAVIRHSVCRLLSEHYVDHDMEHRRQRQ
ncbi:MAG: sporulation protein YqfD [Clostridia bacterium]|nr:sporulation protein YqfD [Clostridia bacterium]